MKNLLDQERIHVRKARCARELMMPLPSLYLFCSGGGHFGLQPGHVVYFLHAGDLH